jgi:hypothetical protein
LSCRFCSEASTRKARLMIGFASAFNVRCTPAEGGAIYSNQKESFGKVNGSLTRYNVKHGRPHDRGSNQSQLLSRLSPLRDGLVFHRYSQRGKTIPLETATSCNQGTSISLLPHPGCTLLGVLVLLANSEHQMSQHLF